MLTPQDISDCVYDEAYGHWVVATILRGDYSVTRKRKQQAGSALDSAAQEK